MKVFTDIAQNGKSQTEVTSVTTPAGKKYYNEGNLGAATQSVTGLLTASDKTKLDGIAAGANKTVVDSSLSTSSANPVQNNIVTTALAGKAAAIHTHSYTDCIIGGGNEKEYIRSLGAKLPVVFGNVFHGLPASAVTIEKSTDSGSTWTDMGISDAVKRNLVCDLTANGIGFNIKSNVGTAYQFRVTIDAAAKGFYGWMDRIYMKISTNGTNDCWCSIYTCAANATAYTLRGTYTISGWSGWNSVPFAYVVYQSASSGQVRYIRLVFGGNHTSTAYTGLSLVRLFGTAYQKWAIPNTMNESGVPYTVDPDLNTTFPAQVAAGKHINSSYNSASYFLMGDGSVATKKNLTSVSHCGWTSTAADALLVPTMNTIACWNGAYNSGGTSNLTYCIKGAFGSFATKSSLAFSELTDKPTTLSGYGITNFLVQSSTTISSDDWRTQSGILRCGAQSGFPSSLGVLFSAYGGSDTFGQLYFNYATNADVYARTGVTSASPAWVRLLNANNYSSYALPLSGGTLTGALTVRSTITATGAISSSTGIWSAGYVSARGQDTSSDIALKKDFSPIGNALEYVKGTHFTRFRWKDGGGESIGIIAQEEERREYGFLVRHHEGVGHLTYDYAASTALLGAALQEEDRKVEELKTRIIELENEIKNLKLCR